MGAIANALTSAGMKQIAALVRQHGGRVMLAERAGRLIQISEPTPQEDPPAAWDAATLPTPL